MRNTGLKAAFLILIISVGLAVINLVAAGDEGTSVQAPVLSNAEQVEPSRPPTETEPQPDIEFEELVYNFGEIYLGEKVTHVFKFKNLGLGVLKIVKIKPG